MSESDDLQRRIRAMPMEEVLALVELFSSKNLEVTLDGGWAVDALLNRETCIHQDLDIALPHQQLKELLWVLETRGYVRLNEPWALEHNFIVRDAASHEVDIHTYVLDELDRNIGGVAYESSQLSGVGILRGREVRCVPAEVSVQFHSGYEVSAKDFQDVLALCKAFGPEIPEVYAPFLNGERD
jgi:lincosamide nucleotidyltransferase A/C/D/E